MLAHRQGSASLVFFKGFNRCFPALRHIFQFRQHCVESVQIRSFFWSLFSCIRTRNNSVFGHFSRNIGFQKRFPCTAILFISMFFRSSCSKFSSKQVFLKISQILQETHLLEYLSDKVASLKVCNFNKKRFQRKCFPLQTQDVN